MGKWSCAVKAPCKCSPDLSVNSPSEVILVFMGFTLKKFNVACRWGEKRLLKVDSGRGEEKSNKIISSLPCMCDLPPPASFTRSPIRDLGRMWRRHVPVQQASRQTNELGLIYIPAASRVSSGCQQVLITRGPNGGWPRKMHGFPLVSAVFRRITTVTLSRIWQHPRNSLVCHVVLSTSWLARVSYICLSFVSFCDDYLQSKRQIFPDCLRQKQSTRQGLV